ncbi:MAG TPA: bifunctional hydroxymethylpyrimidine kinase/phosphomethylpyrimidine kinase [Candidatus Faecousia intestinigallinarum]|nr:bifunctional hydroxymethylpyrimidine kinase/phosphomethylpyrimidine kinase [Candidatus Faecousia intestinigallinarum]
MKRVLAIQSLSVVGRSGLAVMAPVLSSMGCQCCPLPTMVLSAHTGFPSPEKVDISRYILDFFPYYQRQAIRFDAVILSYLPDPGMVPALGAALPRLGSLRIFDPVLGDHGKFYSGMGQGHAAAWRALCRDADILLPNLTEAAALTGLPYRECGDMEYLRTLAQGLRALGAKQVFLTGVPWEEGVTGFFFRNGEGEFVHRQRRISPSLHGTGDLFTAAVAGGVLRGLGAAQAGVLAAAFVAKCLEKTPQATLFGVEFEKILPWLAENAGESKKSS